MDKVPLNIWVDREIFEVLEQQNRPPTQIVSEALSTYLETTFELDSSPSKDPLFSDSAALHVIEAYIERKVAEFRWQMKIELTLFRELLEDLEGKNFYDFEINYR